MADATAEFFAELGTRAHEPLLEKATGTFRFDVTGGRTEYWFVAVKKGDLTVSHRKVKADCVLRADRAVFDGIASGNVNALAATLRGTAVMEGDVGLLASFQRLFPGPPAPKDESNAAGYAKRQS